MIPSQFSVQFPKKGDGRRRAGGFPATQHDNDDEAPCTCFLVSPNYTAETANLMPQKCTLYLLSPSGHHISAGTVIIIPGRLSCTSRRMIINKGERGGGRN